MRRGLGKNGVKWRLPVVLSGFASVILAITAIFIFQDNIVRFSINPRTPYQTTSPPPAPSYETRDGWTVWPEDEPLGAADIFYVHSTTYYSANSWNAPIADPDADHRARTVAAPNEAGPFSPIGPIYAPRYRQATLYSLFTHKYDGLAARETAFADVEAAFDVFLSMAKNPERPIILVGYEQGGLHVLGLLQKRIAASEELRARLAAAYVIGHAIAPEFFSETPDSPRPCQDAEDIRCIVSYVDFEAHFDSMINRARKRDLYWNGDGELREPSGAAPICVNPLSWTLTTDYVGADLHIGAASATGLFTEETPSAVSRAVGARCDRGILIVDQPTPSYLRRRRGFGAQWKVQDFNLFYHDLTADAGRRTALTQVKLTEEATILDPITEAVDLVDNPVNKVPNE
ncbi:MAG: DUF3089 domain-containing protein [Pseudomonadota bacterium]